MTHKLYKRLRERPGNESYEPENPFIDWGAEHFTVDRYRYIIVVNRASILSWIFDGKGINSLPEFQLRASEAIGDCLREYGWDLHYERIILPSMNNPRNQKFHDRSFTGIMMDLVWHAKFHLSEGDPSMYDVSLRLNQMPQCSREEPFPLRAFANLPVT